MAGNSATGEAVLGVLKLARGVLMEEKVLLGG
jgi:hypothetical protein